MPDLKVGATSEVVEVSASEAPLLKTEDAEVSTTLSTVELETFRTPIRRMATQSF